MMPSTSPDVDLTSTPKGLPQLGQFLADKDRVSRAALRVTLVALAVSIASIAYAGFAFTRPPLFVVVDPNGNILPIPGATFPEARELHVREAMLATTALMSRNARGFDQPEFLQGMFSPAANQMAQRVLEADAREFSERQIHQKPQISKIDAVETSSDRVQIQVVGEVLRWGFIQQAPYSDAIPFTLRLTLRSNPDLLRLKLQPLLIESFDLVYATPKR
jgi:hypothetical protein